MEVTTLVVLIVLVGLIFDYTNGFHDAANVVSTVIATKALKPVVAIVIAGILNMVGATQIGGIAHTITTGLIETHGVTEWMVICAVVGAIIWNLVTWYFEVPSSSSYALLGGMLGSAWVHLGGSIILWKGFIFKVFLPMIFSPLIGFSLAYCLMKILSHYYSGRKDARIFRFLQIGSSSIVALAHGLNDAQKSMAIITLGLFAAGAVTSTQIPFWVILACAVTMGLGTAFGGARLIRTMGFHITKLDPIQGFAAEMSASCVILLASVFGMPLSSTHIIAGGITGVGSARGASAVKWIIAHKILVAMVLTIPGAALFAGVLNWIILYLI